MKGNHSQSLIIQADIMNNEYLTRLTEQTFGQDDASRMNFQVAPSIKNSTIADTSFIKENLNATAPIILSQKQLNYLNDQKITNQIFYCKSKVTTTLNSTTP